MSILDSYQGKGVVLPTMHHKGVLVEGTFLDVLGMRVEEIAIDTNQFGTFSGEVKRIESAKNTALKKAQLGLTASGAEFAIASEGTIGPDPLVPFVTSNTEVIVFIDALNNLIITESFRSYEIVAASTTYLADMDLEKFLVKADFPRHKLLVRSDGADLKCFGKAISTVSELKDVISQAVQEKCETIIIENDFRAFASPSRSLNITKAAQRLTERIASLCPECHTPGWGVVALIQGLACSDCGELNEEAVKAQLFGCISCAHQVAGPELAESIDPGRCNWCNP